MQGIQLGRNTYNQQWIYTQHTRKRLAYILWKSRTSEETTPSIENLFAPVEDRRKSTSHAGKKRKTRSSSTVAIGGTRVLQRITYNIFEENRTHGPENRKRSARSIADEEVRDEGETRFIPPPKKQQKGRRGCRKDPWGNSNNICDNCSLNWLPIREHTRARASQPRIATHLRFFSGPPHGTTQKTGESYIMQMRVLLETTRIVICNLIY